MKLASSILSTTVFIGLVAAVYNVMGHLEREKRGTSFLLLHSELEIGNLHERQLLSDFHITPEEQISSSVWVERRVYAQDYLNCFYDWLKSFETGYSFNFPKFMVQINGIRETLANIEFLTETTLNEVYNIDQQLIFVQRVFDQMVTAAEKSRLYSSSKTNYTGAHLVNEMIQLKVRIYTLYNIHGDPDTKVNNYDEKFHHLYCDFKRLLNEFNQADGIVYGMKNLFTKEAGEANELLEKLQGKAGIDFQTLISCGDD